jgi:hypothetical protein
VVAVLALAGLVAAHHGMPMDMHAMPAAAMCLAVVGAGVAVAAAIGVGFRSGLRLWPSGSCRLRRAHMMITHHQGAMRMARAELNKGGNAELRAIARAIVSAQKGEITEMNRWRKQWYGGTSPSGGIPPS